MRKIDQLLNAYGVSHQNETNKFIHWICVPTIFFSLFGLLMSIPWPFGPVTWWSNWAALSGALALLYYLRLSLPLSVGFILVMLLTLWGNHQVGLARPLGLSLPLFSILIFALAWIGQFIGHKIEGAKPSFLEDVQFLLIGPAWLMHFIFKKLGIDY